MSQRLKVLMTGGSGFLGQHVQEALHSIADVDVISRSPKSEINGDLTKWNADIDLTTLKDSNYNIFLHMAGLYNLSASRHDVLLNNVVGTNTALKLASSLKIPVFINTSSVAAATNFSQKIVNPYDLSFSQPFHDYYAESKALSEQQIANWLSPIRLKINLRLGVLVGDTANGKIQRIDGPYHIGKIFSQLRTFIEKWKLPLPVPGNPKVRLPLVPVDIAAKAITDICLWSLNKNDEGYKSFHIVPNEGIKVKDLYLSGLSHLKIKHNGLKLVEKIPQTLATKISQYTLGFPEEQLRYALSLPKFNSEETIKVLGKNWCPEFSDYEAQFWRGYEKFLSYSRN